VTFSSYVITNYKTPSYDKIAFRLYANSVAMKCACCGGDMLPEKDIGTSVIYKCAECGLSDTRLKEEAKENS
jgi:hypothetical protein